MKSLMKISLFTLFTAICALVQTPAFAGSGAESHGGQVVFCPGAAPVLLDYYQATLPTEAGGTPELTDISKMSAQDVLDLFKNRLAYSNLWYPYFRALEVLGPVDSWLEGNLQSVPDSDPAYTLPPNCSLQQLAVRQDSTMYVDPKILAQISPAQQGLLMAHEALYYVAQQNGHDSSVEVRMVIRNLLLKNENEVALSKSVHELGSTFFWWENFANHEYFDEANSGKIYGFYLSYDPLVDGENLNYAFGYTPTPGSSVPTANGTFHCGGEPFVSECRTVSGPHACTLAHFAWTDDNNEMLVLTCSDINLTAVMTTQKILSASATKVTP